MNRTCALLFVCVAALLASARAAEALFSSTLSAADFAGAGLTKLTPEELARLNALVAARHDAPAPIVAPAAGRARNVDTPRAAVTSPVPSAEKPAPGLLERAKVLVAPGTEVEYASVDSRIVGEFRGWERRTTFTLENGDRWQTTSADAYVSPPIMNPAVHIAPGRFGGFWMTIDGVNQRVRVTPITVGK